MAGVMGLMPCLTLPYLTFGVGRLLHLPSVEAVSVRPNVQPRCNQKVTVIGCEAETSAVKPNKSPATWDWWRVVWLFLSGGLRLVSSSPSDYKSSGSSVHKPHHHTKVADLGGDAYSFLWWILAPSCHVLYYWCVRSATLWYNSGEYCS